MSDESDTVVTISLTVPLPVKLMFMSPHPKCVCVITAYHANYARCCTWTSGQVSGQSLLDEAIHADALYGYIMLKIPSRAEYRKRAKDG